MSKFCYTCFFYFFLQLLLITSKTIPQAWTPDTLHNRLKETYLHQNNPNYKQNLHYMKNIMFLLIYFS